ncbi:hypothetical protein AVEN_148683-1 [Araneus ventricosus]|uniref:Uncharacterized protein n=1 Tax=Araneus ventricosus TaxID=182803 RepID=A0A4Y2G7Y5_ARAVE|nr:hypothetical protein AVEN_148683-1 [Araneus ventricosus]
MIRIIYLVVALLIFEISFVSCQFDFGESTKGERQGELSPGAIAGVTFGVVAIFAGLTVTILFCYYVRRKQKQQLRNSTIFLPPRNGKTPI